MDSPARRIAYLSLQAVVDGQDTWAAVTEIVKGIEAEGWSVDRFFVDYGERIDPSALTRLAEMFRVQRRLARLLSDYEGVYIRAHPVAWWTARRARGRGVPVIQECNGPYEDLFIAWPRARVARRLFEWMQREQYRRASAIIAVSEGLNRWLTTQTDNPHIYVNGNGANVEVFSPDAQRRAGLPDRFVVFFGQFPAWQGIQTLLEAVQSARWPADVPLVFVGGGALQPAVESAASRTPERVRYIGRLPYEEVATVVAHAEIAYVPMVAPEREAKFSPLKLYESMACGVPVVASDTIGISEVVNDFRCGVLVAPGDTEGIVDATLELLSDADTARAMGHRGRDAVVEHFSWRARARQRLAVIEDAIGVRQGP